MGNVVQRLALGVVLIVLGSAALLYTDSGGAVSAGGKRRVAILQHSSTPVLDDGVRGMIDGLAEKGWRDGDKLSLQKFNAEGDVSTANSIAQEVVNGGGYEMVLTSSTPSLQAVYTANRAGRVMQVFTLVADPFSAGVGLERDNPAKHPRTLVGLGIRVPVDQVIRTGRKLNPNLKRFGMVWNPGESNSQASTLIARDVCKKEGIELLEANAENTSAVAEACDSVIARGAQAIIVGGDNTMAASIVVVIDTAKKARIPVLTSMPDLGKLERGSLIDIGTDYYEAGKLSGLLAGDILNGTDPATIPIRDAADLVPPLIVVNETALTGLKETWRIPNEVAKQATVVIDSNGVHRRVSPTR
jgi:putative ABC transport system substrate-binding protein